MRKITKKHAVSQNIEVTNYICHSLSPMKTPATGRTSREVEGKTKTRKHQQMWINSNDFVWRFVYKQEYQQPCSVATKGR